MKTKFFLGFVLFLLIASLVTANSPEGHYGLGRDTLDEIEDTRIKQLVEENIDAFYTCSILNDISVPFYFTSFQDYKDTHQFTFCQAMKREAQTERELVCAYACETHLAQDIVSHNFMVPACIEKYKIFNNAIMHPICELAFSNHFYSNDAEVINGAKHMLDGSAEFLPLYVRTAGKDNINGIKINSLFQVLGKALGSDDYYGDAAETVIFDDGKPSSFSVIGNSWAIYKFVGKPAIKVVSLNNYEDLRRMNVENVKNVLRGQPDMTFDPSGDLALHEAEGASKIVGAVIFILFILGLGWLSWKLIMKVFDSFSNTTARIIASVMIVSLAGFIAWGLWIFSYAMFLLLMLIYYVVSAIVFIVKIIQALVSKISLGKFSIISIVYFIIITILLLIIALI